MIDKPETQVLIIIVTLSLLVIVFVLLRIIFLLFRKYGVSKKKGDDFEKEKTETPPPPGLDRIALDEMERKWNHYIDLQFEKLKEQMIKFIDEKVKNLPVPGGNGTSDQTEKKEIEPPTRTPPHLYQKEEETPPDFQDGNDQVTCLLIYNAAITNPEEERQFRRQYKPIRVDVVNAMQRKRDPDIEPIFQSTDSGDFFVVELKDDDPRGRTSFIVLPRFGLTISDSNYGAGGVGYVFKCPGYDRQQVYGIKSVVSPAIFAREGHDHWNLISMGELELAPEEYEDK